MRKLFAAISIAFALAVPVTLATAGPAVAGEEECVPSDAYTETTDWVLQSPGDGWYQVDQRTVTDQEAYDEVVTPAVDAQHYSYTGGPIEGTPGTTPPGDGWQANTEQEPHLNNPNVTWVDGFGVGLHYTGEPGRANFFYFQPAVPAVIVHHDAVTHEEYKFAFDHEAVVCPPDEPTPTPTVTPTPPPPTETPEPPVDEPKWTPTWTPEPKVHQDPTRHDLAHTGLDVTGAAMAMELLGSLGFGALALSRRKH